MSHLALGAICTFASFNLYAQSSVTLYGLVDAGLNYLSNAQTGRSDGKLIGHSQYSFQDGVTGGQNGSRWGLLGTEDLGGGMSAIFRLESGFSIGTGALGQGGAGVGRQAYVGLKSPAGTVTLGRQYDPVATTVGPFAAAAQWGGYMASHAVDVDNFLNTRRINNSVKYQSPDFKGLSFSGMYSFGGVPGSVGSKQLWSAGVGYANGAFSAGAAYLNARNPNLSFYGTNPNAGTTPATNNIGSVGSTTSAQSNPIYAGYASANTVQIIGAGAAYQIGAATLGATYSNVQFKGLGNTASSGPNPFGYSGNATFNVAEANLKYQITPSLLAGVAYSYTHNSGSDGKASASYHQGALGLDYFLSKRTDVYTIVVYQHASGTDSFNQPAVAQITGQTASATDSQTAVRVGIRHRF
ncbi:porin [Paraburkholderia sp. PGU19]|uniref:porin n=1 Tax=Paraburkholderia sp. PGU19 TaxID=2735434 RepID=UPI001FB15C16|nr:porin [Paraburkholderia sp. PGU19]